MKSKELALKLDALRVAVDGVNTQLFWAKDRLEKAKDKYMEQERAKVEVEALQKAMDKLVNNAFTLVKEWHDERHQNDEQGDLE